MKSWRAVPTLSGILLLAGLQGCAAFPSIKDLGTMLSGQMCIDAGVGWNGGPVLSLGLKACVEEGRIRLGEGFEYTAALDVCAEAMTGDKADTE